MNTERSKLFPGTQLGELTLLGRVNKPTARTYLKKQWKVQCSCTKIFVLPEYYLVRKGNPRRDCGGHTTKSLKSTFKQEYGIWLMMHQRCLFAHHKFYKYYGGRGIKIAKEWLATRYGGELDDKGFERFIEHIKKRPSEGHSVDRINVDGNYEPGNVRWATAKEQAANKRK